jgi:oxaloacetate decarboxylase (Na+ extruding) subunit gamma
MQGDIVNQGVELMLYGMGTVVVFLAVLIGATNFMSWCVARYFPEPEIPMISASPVPVAAAKGTDNGQLLAVISAAIHRHRQGKE